MRGGSPVHRLAAIILGLALCLAVSAFSGGCRANKGGGSQGAVSATTVPDSGDHSDDPPPAEPAPVGGNDGDDKFTQGDPSTPVTGINLVGADFDNARTRCGQKQLDTTTYKIICRVAAVQSNGGELEASFVKPGVKITWEKPTQLSGSPVTFKEVAVAGDDSLVRTYEVDKSVVGRASKLNFALTVRRDKDLAVRTESDQVVLGYSVGVAAGLVPFLPYAYAPGRDAALGAQLTNDLPLPLGHQREVGKFSSWRDTLAYLTADSCWNGQGTFFATSGQVFRRRGEEIFLYAGSYKHRNESKTWELSFADKMTSFLDGRLYADPFRLTLPFDRVACTPNGVLVFARSPSDDTYALVEVTDDGTTKVRLSMDPAQFSALQGEPRPDMFDLDASPDGKTVVFQLLDAFYRLRSDGTVDNLSSIMSGAHFPICNTEVSIYGPAIAAADSGAAYLAWPACTEQDAFTTIRRIDSGGQVLSKTFAADREAEETVDILRATAVTLGPNEPLHGEQFIFAADHGVFAVDSKLALSSISDFHIDGLVAHGSELAALHANDWYHYSLVKAAADGFDGEDDWHHSLLFPLPELTPGSTDVLDAATVAIGSDYLRLGKNEFWTMPSQFPGINRPGQDGRTETRAFGANEALVEGGKINVSDASEYLYELLFPEAGGPGLWPCSTPYTSANIVQLIPTPSGRLFARGSYGCGILLELHPSSDPALPLTYTVIAGGGASTALGGVAKDLELSAGIGFPLEDGQGGLFFAEHRQVDTDPLTLEWHTRAFLLWHWQPDGTLTKIAGSAATAASNVPVPVHGVPQSNFQFSSQVPSTFDFNAPVARLGDGSFIMASPGGRMIYKITPDGKIYTVTGGGDVVIVDGAQARAAEGSDARRVSFKGRDWLDSLFPIEWIEAARDGTISFIVNGMLFQLTPKDHGGIDEYLLSPVFGDASQDKCSTATQQGRALSAADAAAQLRTSTPSFCQGDVKVLAARDSCDLPKGDVHLFVTQDFKLAGNVIEIVRPCAN